MSTVAKSMPADNQPVTLPPRIPWTAVVWFVGLLLICYGPALLGLMQIWETDEDMGHGFFVPIIAGYIAWQKREELAALHWKPNYLGLVLMAFAALQYYIGSLGAEQFLTRTAFVEALIGVVFTLGGWQAVRALAFPLGLLFFMIPIPAIIYNRITFPLQLFASSVAETVLMMIGIPVLREGNILELASQRLSVVEACSGIRSLLSLTFLSLVYGYFFENRVWVRVVLFFATIPIAIIANSGRVSLTGILSEYKPELAHGFFHTASGWVIFMIALVILIGFHQLLTGVIRLTHAKQQLVAH
ncbi:MAG TPA: exosortase/archaeosortase family protein [Bryobacteraceae bacterium]|nr:exosortase/archaeosortase family protein [Bryobacteraceae bacterium]